MISVGSRDLRYLFEGEKMEFETEFEDGEAYFQKNHKFGNENDEYYDDDDDDDDSAIDPDVSLSYIDEKIQDVLGHCQKDFEGGVSAEKLGPKFGGYGSFLPSYHRSPVCSNPKTPPKVLTYSSPVSPNIAHIEVGYQNPVSQSSASKSARNRPSSFSAGSGSTRKGSSSNLKSKQESKSRSVSNSANDSDQQSLKVRIKLGTDHMLPKSKAEIYSGLGLDISPSSSLEASPVNSSGFFHPDESPTSILEMMTSFPVSGSVLLSPLPYDILHLTEKKTVDNSCGPVHKGSQESTVTALHGSDLLKVDQNVLGEKLKPKSTEKNSASMESTNGDEIRNSVSVKKETSVDNFAPRNKTSTSSGKRKSGGGLKNNSFTSKSKNNFHGSKSYNDDFKKNNVKVEETYRDFFGDLDLDHDDHDEFGLEKPSEGINVKSTLENSGLSKEKLNGEKSQKPSSVYAKADSHVPIMDNGVESAVVAPAVVPLVNEDWVCCDKCEKWRLLPPGVNPKSLPEKWLCSMLDWLPGMNRCNISEEETTKAITSHFPGPSIQGSQPVHPVGPELGVITHDVSYPDGTHQSFGVKKKHGLKDLPNEAKPSLSSNSLKKNAHTSYKTRSLNDVIQSPVVNEVDFQDSGQSRAVIVEKDRIKQKENNAYEGKNIRHSKIGIKRESTQDFTKEYKKVKTDKNDGKFDKRDVTKKRKKVNEIDDTGKYVKETCEASHRKEKKARVFDEGKQSKSKNVKDSTKGSSRRDPVLAATSSSSKISGSRKMKNNNQETKGSPVESVSSSPMRIMNTKVVDFDQPLTKNVDTRSNEEKSNGGRNGSQGNFVKGSASKESSLMKNVSQDSKIRTKQDVSRKGKSNSLPPRSQNEVERKENVGNNNNNNMSSKATASNKKVQNQNRNQPVNIKDPPPNRYNGKDLDPNVVLVRDLSNQATTNALREATKLKHMADRIKNAGSSVDSRALYMQAALKFLYSASLFESCYSKTGRHGDRIQSNSIYSSTIKLCEFCAQEYERTKEMTTAALAYKCMEVACMKVIYSSHATDCKAVNELQTFLQINPTVGESPSSSASASASASASDLDNLNIAAAVDKAALAKGVNNSSQGAGHHVITAKNKPNFTRILTLAQVAVSAMDASRKSRSCYEAAASKQEIGLSEVKKALDFNFHDVEGFLHLVRVAMEVICR